MKRSAVVKVLLTSTTLLAGCDHPHEYKSIDDCVAAGYRIEQCQPRTHAGGGGGSNPWLWYWMGRNSGTTYVPMGSPASAIVSTSRPAATSSAPTEGAPAASARGGFGTTGAAHATGVGE